MRWGVEQADGPSPSLRRSSAGRGGRTLGVGAASVAGHLALGLALFAALAKPTPATYDPQPITVALVTLPTPASPPPAPPGPAKSPRAKSAPAAAVASVLIARLTPTPIRAAAPVADTGQASPAAAVGLSDAALSGAATAGSGGEGGCNMVRRLEDDLRRDQLVQAAVAGFSGRAVMVWNGDWVWLDGEDGKGLTAVRQAMMWDIAFAPEACKARPMHGLVIIAANPAHVRLVVGGSAWRWSDLLVPHPSGG